MNNIKLLYAEDDIQTQRIYSEIFKKYFDLVDTCSNGEEALNLFKINYYDIVILDINMPYINGLELVSLIKEIKKDTKIIIFTAFKDSDKLLQAIKLQVDDYLLKPISIKDLETAINNIKEYFEDKDNIYLIDNIIWNKKLKILKYKNIRISLTKKELLLLDILSSNTDDIFHKDIILKYIWFDSELNTIQNNTLSKLISRFKKKIYEHTNKDIEIIKNCYSLGYALHLKNN